MFCKKCQTQPSIRETTYYISVMCKCQITIIYPNQIVRTITKQEYDQRREREQNVEER